MEPFISHRNVERDAVEDSALMTVPLKHLAVGPNDGIASTEFDVPWTFKVEAVEGKRMTVG